MLRSGSTPQPLTTLVRQPPPLERVGSDSIPLDPFLLRFLPELIDLIMTDRITPGDVFELTLPFDQAAEGYRAMDERHAIKVLLTF